MPAAGAAKPLMLVVEDERAIAQAVAARLRAEGFAVDTAADGPSAIWCGACGARVCSFFTCVLRFSGFRNSAEVLVA